MNHRFIMTAFGKDRVGIVADVTSLLYENHCNLEDTNMNLLADEFTLNLLFSSSQGNVEEQLSQECRRLERDKGISAFVRQIPPLERKVRKGYKTCTLHIESLDQAGIVYKISQFLADNNLNIVQLKSTPKASPESGATIYSIGVHIQVPEEISLDQVEDDLSAMADEMQVDISMSR